MSGASENTVVDQEPIKLALAAGPLNAEQRAEAVRMLRHQSTVFAHVSEKYLQEVAKRMLVVMCPKESALIKQGDTQDRMFVVSQGEVHRIRLEPDGTRHHMDTYGRQETKATFGALHFLKQDPSFATAKCVEDARAYMMTTTHFKEMLKDSKFSEEVIYSLSREVRRQTNLLRTPLLEQRSKKVANPLLVVSIAAGTESFYRAGLNAAMNARLSGKMGAWFPNMHIQIPIRMVYINGIKESRRQLDKVDSTAYDHPALVGLAKTCAPGLVMTPMSSLLEASNAGHMNPESMATRWIRGYGFRCVREVIFGIGLNQMSDYCEERMPFESPVLRNAAGSMASGVISGYISHIPHNLSTLKLMTPDKSYLEHMKILISQSESRVPPEFTGNARWLISAGMAIVFPRACLIRTTQIVGSFVILNGMINMLKNVEIPF